MTDHVAFLDGAVESAVVDGFDELIRHTLVVRFLHGLHHIVSLLALAVHQQFVGFLDAAPALVAVHGIEASHDAGDASGTLCAVVGQLLDEALAALGVGITAVHEAVDKGAFADAIFLGDVAELEEVVQRRVYATVGGQAHEVDVFAVLLGVREGRDNFLVLQDAAVGTGAVDLHQVLVNDASGADIEVSHFGVAHLSVGQAHILTTGLELRVRIVGQQAVPIRSGGHIDYVVFLAVADSPTVQNHKKSFLCHNIYRF